MTLSQRFKRLSIWNKLGVIASILTVITFVAWLVSCLIPERSKPYPSLTNVSEQQPPFCIRFDTVSWNGLGERPNEWIVQSSGVTPIYFSILASFVNLKTVPVLIHSYLVEQETTNGTWQQINYQCLGIPGKIYWGEDPKNVRELKCGTFDSAIQSDIAPNGTISGWIFFTHPPKRPLNLRFSFMDSAGILYSPQPITDYSNRTFSAQSKLVDFTTNSEDISGLLR